MEDDIQLYHYTSLDAAVKIIQSDGLHFHGSRHDSMNDPYDCIYATNIIYPHLEEESGISIEDHIRFYPYVVSFSTEKDRLDMWRLYNAEVALVINWSSKATVLDKDVHDELYSRKVEYLNENEVYEKGKQMLSDFDFEYVNDVYAEWNNKVIPFIKHPDFKIEKEFRMVRFDYDGFIMEYDKNANTNKTFEMEMQKDIQIRDVKNGDIRFYKDFWIDKNHLKGIIVYAFDKDKFQSIKKHLQLWLQQCDYDTTKIIIEQTTSSPVIR